MPIFHLLNMICPGHATLSCGQIQLRGVLSICLSKSESICVKSKVERFSRF